MRRIVLDLLELLNGAGWSAMQHRVALVDSIENQAACKSNALSVYKTYFAHAQIQMGFYVLLKQTSAHGSLDLSMDLLE